MRDETPQLRYLGGEPKIGAANDSPTHSRPHAYARRAQACPEVVSSFSVGVDQQIGSDFSLTVRYVHQRTRDLPTRRIINQYNVPPGHPNFGKTTDGVFLYLGREEAAIRENPAARTTELLKKVVGQ